MDFIEGLPLSDGFDTILVVVCRLTKMGLFIPTHKTVDTEGVASLFLRHVFSKHGAPSDIVSDRGKHFVSRFWRSLCHTLNIKSNLSTAYHPETDGQTERLNQILEQYLRIYINYEQDNWAHFLPLAEFTYNNTKHSATQVTPFFANKGFHPTLELSLDSVPSAEAHSMVADLKELRIYLQEQLKITIAQYEAATIDRRKKIPPFSVGDEVWLDARNIRTKRTSKKLDHKRLGPFPIIEKVSSHAFRLGLTPSMSKLHNVFHVSLLEPTNKSSIPNRRQDPPPPVEIAGEDEYEVDRIVNSERRRGRVVYLVQWKGYEDRPDFQTWETPDNLANAPLVVEAFHRAYPDKPKP
jgi:hypothetical protein